MNKVTLRLQCRLNRTADFDLRATVEELEPRRLLSAVVARVATFPPGFNPGPPTAGLDGNFYGLGDATGDKLYKADPRTGVVTEIVLPGPTKPDKSYPFYDFIPQGNKRLVGDGAGNFYGVTLGDVNGNGSVFELKNGSDTVTTIASVEDPYVSSDYDPLTIDANGNLYGVTKSVSTYSNLNWTVFEVPKDSGTAVTVASVPTAYGAPTGDLLVNASGDVFGTTGGRTGVFSYSGSVFKILRDTGVVINIHSFSDIHSAVTGLIRTPDGTIYGGLIGGPLQYFTTTQTLNSVVTIHSASVDASAIDVTDPYPTDFIKIYATDTQGNLFGFRNSVNYYPDNDPQISDFIEVAAGTGTVTSLVYPENDGTLPDNISIDSDGNLIGTCSQGGLSDLGGIYEIEKGSGKVRWVEQFGQSTLGSPSYGLVKGSDGNFYGTTEGYDQETGGSLYKVTSTSPYHLVFTQQPVSEGGGGVAFPPVIVSIEDAAGNLVTTDDSDVTISSEDPGVYGLPNIVAKVATIAAVNGVATFSNLPIAPLGKIDLIATADPIYSATSEPFTVVLGIKPTVAILKSSARVFETDRSCQLNCTVKALGNSTVIPTGVVTIFEDGIKTSATGMLDATGTAVISLGGGHKGPNHLISFQYSGDGNYGVGFSNTLRQEHLPAADVVGRTDDRYTVVPTTGVAGQRLDAVMAVRLNSTDSFRNRPRLRTYTEVLYVDTSSSGLSGKQVALRTKTFTINVKHGLDLPNYFRIKKLPASLPSGTYFFVLKLTDSHGYSRLTTTPQSIVVTAPRK